MARKNNPEKTKQRIIEISARLFAEKGYAKTTMQNIVEELGMSKGAIFYHFASKEEIVDAVIERYRKFIMTKVKKIADDYSLSTKERVIKILLSLNMNDIDGVSMVEYLLSPENALIYQRVEIVFFRDITEILGKVIEKGVEEGIFDTSYPKESVEFILRRIRAFDLSEMQNLTIEELELQIRAVTWGIERILGCKDGEMSELKTAFSNLSKEYTVSEERGKDERTV
ncbi:transcriptional regulator, TetR family [Pilibacter termitis]|uniref:Transcriptional regulator, TetR family n=1 Tax=Pilibacter termitis TaxID=263852 RepID=A0A1T4P4Z5_9ENTE|nr:TetR/AcrR family transcriptional regulator [Pilibacter termitis]SJZ86471.1 transcriptional regulator, TetR family [Pilibacter termitis]